MGLIIDLQREAISKESEIVSLLRKAYLVSRKLKLKDFESWIKKELNGYEEEDIVPKYRLYSGNVKALNPCRGWIPVVVYESPIDLSIHEMRYSVASMVDIYNKGEGKFVLYFDDKTNIILSRFSSFETKFRLEVSTSLIAYTIDSIRNHILEWAITLEENGIKGEGLSFTDVEMKTAIETPAICYYTNNFYGDVANTQIQQGTDNSEEKIERLCD